MNLEEFANSAAQTGILTHQETIDVFLHFTASNKPQLCFSTKPRQGLKTQVSEMYYGKIYIAKLKFTTQKVSRSSHNVFILLEEHNKSFLKKF